MFDTLKLIYTQEEAFELVSRYEKVYNEKIKELEEENKKLKESLDIATKCSSKEEDGIIRLSEENKKLKENIAWYEKEEDRLKEENKKLKEKLEKWEKDYKEGIIVHCRNG